MRIAMFSNTYLPFIGGVPISVERLKTGLERQGHDVRVICPSYGGADPDPTVIRVPVILGVGDIFKMSNPLHLATSRAVRTFNPDVVHVHHPYWLGGSGLRLARRLGVPVVFTYHTRLEQFAHAVPLMGIIFRNVLSHWIVRRFANLCDEIIVPTPVTRDYIRLIGVNRPVHVLPTGVELERYHIADDTRLTALKRRVNPDDRLLLVTVARLSREKNLDFIIEAMAHLKRRDVQPFRLIVLGEGQERAHLEQLIREHDLTDTVELVGNVSYDDVPAYLAVASAFVYASSSETQGMVILEAMAAGLPVVAVNASGIDAFVQNRKTGFVTTENVELWTEALHHLLAHPAEAERMRHAARKAAQNYSVDAFASGAGQVYRTALGARAGRKK